MRRTEIEGSTGRASNNALDPSPPQKANLIPFPKSKSPPRSLDADGEPPLPSAFVSVGNASQAVVLRLRDGFPKLKVRVTDWEEEIDHPR